MTADQRVRAAIQAKLDELGDGWQLAQHVIVMSLERVTDAGIETIAWYWTPDDQADWMTTGLLDRTLDLNQQANASRDDM